ncbi:flocculation-associated PEP-CTERM protein PepA [Pelomonas sp. KK5]|uniref:flocculation-associated PEP-CTERM protein PepA n=1 Tax=Pelomonas sp. KK5 TaxID=1855730 RepID=UPI00097CA615|nr:flocculation-associated PEP-CTERM protein PepA [Pelomonas sp. KK5]
MNQHSPSSLRQAAVALSLLALSAGASAALTTFTLDPVAAGLSGAAFTADNLLISDYATVTNGVGGSFTETGFLSITGAQLNNQNLTVPGLNSSYGLYIAFTGTGTSDGNNPLTQVSLGNFSTLTYTLYGYNGAASFGFSGTTPTTTAASPTPLASGSLVNGSVFSFPTGTSFFPGANATVNFNTLAAAFFAAPSPFSSEALVSFSNTPSQVALFAGGFMINSGGGTINFAAPVPEPHSYAMLMAGLGVLGLVARRRRR